jgi:hypothetical protein
VTDLTRPDRGEALARLTDKMNELGPDEGGVYFMLCMASLAKNAPDVAMFIMDRVDANLEAADEALR